MSIALVYALGKSLFADASTGLLAATVLAVSPFDILFASTVFTDPWMVALILGALLAATTGRLGRAGLLTGLAIASKQQGLLFLPLVIGVGILSPRQPSNSEPLRMPPAPRSSQVALAFLERVWAQRWLRFVLGVVAVAGGVLWWDLAREQRPGFLEQSLISYGGLGTICLEDLGPRAIAWLQLVASFWVSPWFNALVVFLVFVWFLGGLVGWWSRWSFAELALAGFAASFLLLHWLVGFQLWSRYLLGLVPLAALILARAILRIQTMLPPSSWRRTAVVGFGLLLGCLLLGVILQATRSELPVGGDHGAYDGIDELAQYIAEQAPAGAVLYHYWLGSHYRFYLYGAPLRLHWYPDRADLTRDATIYRREPRYIAFPSWRDERPASEALASAGIRLVPVFDTTRRDGSTSFRLYRLRGP
jgi:hypothetical protein